jgi:hypothetical protein
VTDECGSSREWLCPSARCADGVLLLGIIGVDGRVFYIDPALRIDEDFVKNAEKGRAPEKRFRFAAPCMESNCTHWTGDKCGVIDRARSAAETTRDGIGLSAPLSSCSVRPKCRWFAQAGAAACSVCPFLFNYVWPNPE